MVRGINAKRIYKICGNAQAGYLNNLIRNEYVSCCSVFVQEKNMNKHRYYRIYQDSNQQKKKNGSLIKKGMRDQQGAFYSLGSTGVFKFVS